MNRILTREQYLDTLRNQNYSVYTNIPKVKEAFSNDVNWGDSLLGRLINSAIRITKIGYKETKVPKLLEQFKSQLDVLISSSFTKELAGKYNFLYVKSCMEEIKDICLSTETKEEKLEKLIGWDGESAMWDTKNPKSDGRRLDGSPNIIQNIIDRVTNKLPNLEKFMASERNDFLDNLSNFSEDLRKLTIVGTSGGSESQVKSFSLKFGDALNAFVNISINDSFKFLKYNEFINEENTENEVSISNTKSIAKKLVDEIENKDEDDIKKLDSFLKFKTEFAKLSNDDIEKIKKEKIDGENLYDTICSLASIEKKETTKQTQQSNLTLETGKWYVYKTSKIVELLSTTNEMIKKPSKSGSSWTWEKGAPLTDKNKCIVVMIDTNTKDEVGSVFSIDKNSLLKEFPMTRKPIKFSESIDNSIFDSSFIFEDDGEDDGDGAGGVGGRPEEEPKPNNTGEPKQKSVEEVWNKYWKEIEDKSGSFNLTQREVDDLIKLEKSGNDEKLIDISKDPDPIISLVRVFSRAHELYYSDVIPSGRTDGKVSNKTFREYICLGSDAGKPSSPGAGPWAVKSIFDKWRDGVLKIIEDQEYRKILANIKFVVPGAEDNFNKSPKTEKYNLDNGFKKIFEASPPLTSDDIKTDSSSHGQILFDFINDMIDKTTAADFDAVRKKLLKKYFGIKDNSIPKTKIVPKSINTSDLESKSLIWQPSNEFKKDVLYAIPVKDLNPPSTGKHHIIFLNFIAKVDTISRQGQGNVKTALFVKFTFDNQLMVNSLKNSAYSDYKLSDWSTQEKPAKNIYYGIINIDKRKISLSYVNVNYKTTLVKDDIYKGYERFEITNERKTFPNGTSKSLTMSKLAKVNESKEIQEITKSNERLDREIGGGDNDTIKKIKIGEKTLYDCLIEEFPFAP